MHGGQSPHIPFQLSLKENRALGECPSPLCNRSLLDKRREDSRPSGNSLCAKGKALSAVCTWTLGDIDSYQAHLMVSEDMLQRADAGVQSTSKMPGEKALGEPVQSLCLLSHRHPSPRRTGSPTPDRMWLWARAKCEKGCLQSSKKT